MKILILNWRDIMHPLAGGAEQSLFKHASYWEKKGADVTWITSCFPGAKKSETVNGIRIIRMGSHFTVHFLAANYYRKLDNIDIIIDSFHFIPFFSPLYTNPNKIIALINEPAKNAWFKNIFFPVAIIGYIIEPFFFKLYNNIPFITSANSIKKELEELGVNGKKINIIPHGVTVKNSAKKYIKEQIPTIIYLSQVSPDKGIEDALQAFQLLQNENKSINLWIVGKAISESYQKKIKMMIDTLRIKKNTTYFGFVTEEKKFELLQKAWILIHPSIREGWGLNVIEANNFGVPSVGYNVTGLKDSIKDNKTGLLTRKNTPEDLAEKCMKILTDKKTYNYLAKNSKKWANEFSWEKSAKKSWGLIKDTYEKSK